MKVYFLLAAAVTVLTGCSTTQSPPPSASGPESMMITYHVIPGKEQEFQELLSGAWEVYLKENMVFAKPHLVVKAVEEGNKIRYTEIFTWVQSPNHPPESVKRVWEREQALCEARNGHKGIGGGEVRLITGP